MLRVRTGQWGPWEWGGAFSEAFQDGERAREDAFAGHIVSLQQAMRHVLLRSSFADPGVAREVHPSGPWGIRGAACCLVNHSFGWLALGAWGGLLVKGEAAAPAFTHQSRSRTRTTRDFTG